MYRKSDGLRFSPTDLIVFLDGEFGSWMDRWYLEQKRAARAETSANPASLPLLFQPDGDSAELGLIRDKGIEHERAFLAWLKAQGGSVVEIAQSDDAVVKTLQAMRDGAQVIYQACVEATPFGGYADFLNRQEGTSSLGSHHYEVWDTKLAKSVKPYFVIQLCAYAEMLETIQGVRPQGVEIVLGTNERRRLRTNDYFYYYRCLKNFFLKFHDKFDPTQMPHPGFSLEYGRWSEAAEKILAESDHLIGVARMTRLQIKRLEKAGIKTIAALASSTQATVVGIDAAILGRLRKQAQLQIASNGKDKPVFEVVTPLADDPRRGLALLPPASPGDVYFDMEGYPLADGGLEYLFGATYQEGTALRFADWWAHDPIQEKAAFIGFVTWAHQRWQHDPHMHIYHYAPYEPTALRRLMGKYAACEKMVDELLRNQVFVDLYAVVRQGLMVGAPSYSLKQVERLYMPPREGSVTSASGSIIAYQAWMESGEAQGWQQSPLLKEIRDYNQVDCDSTCELATWLRALQKTHNIAYLPEQHVEAGGADDKEPAAENPAKVLAERLLSEIEAGTILGPEHRRVQELLAWLLEFHWREAKPVFWAMFDRHAMTEEELIADLDCLGGLQRTATPPQPVARSRLVEYRYDPDQDTKLSPGSKCFYAHDLQAKVAIETMDQQQGLVQIRVGPSVKEVPDRLSLIPNEHVSAKIIADAVLERGISARLVKIGGDADEPLIEAGAIEHTEHSADAVDILGSTGVVIGGTAWVFSRSELEGLVDYLFIDEAGQVSLASIVATGLCAKNIILVGDQMQLSQPTKGSHPGESGLSALDYLLQGHATIPDDLGVFLGTTYRMHPDVCQFISDAVYDGRLGSHPSTARHAVLCGDKDNGLVQRKSGVIFVPVEHEGNAQASDEEIDAIVTIVKQLLGRCVVERDGQQGALLLSDILIVAPYNMQVRRLKARLGADARIGSVDKFQGQEAHVVIVSMCASSIEECPRGVEFLLNKNRINVAVSRAKSLAIVVGCPNLMAARCRTVEQMEMVNLYCWLAAYAEGPQSYTEQSMNKIEVILTKGKETKGTYVYEEDVAESGKPPVLKTQYIQKWALGSNPPDKIKVTIEAM